MTTDLDAMMRRTPRAPAPRPMPTAPSASQVGYRMPGEFEPQSAVWLAWPGATSRRWADTPALLADCAALARTILRFEPVHVAVDPAYSEECAAWLGNAVRRHLLPVDDIWIRDTGPSFVVDSAGRLGAAMWSFNTWGDKFDGYEADAGLARRIAGVAGAREFVAGLITEGGALHVDGEGTVVVTDSSVLNSNRNPGMTREELELALHAALGTRKAIWLPGGAGSDSITDGHVDGLMTFVKPGAALFDVSDDISHPQYHEIGEKLRALQLARDARGRTLEIATVTRPRELPSANPHFCGLYVNCLIVNGGVVIPEFGDARADAAARAVFEKAFADREVVSLRIDSVAGGGGGIHCITQQLPAGTGLPP